MIGLNAKAHIDAISENVFLEQAAALGVDIIMDIGANTGQFAEKIRSRDFNGLVFSVEPQLACRGELVRRSKIDPNWIVVPNQGAGATKGMLELNISENSYSSSFFEVHENHLRAEPKTRIVRKELVPISRTDEMLPQSFIERVGAIKIDTQGFELEVLKGISDKFKSLRLMQVELSAVECYAGAPDMETVDAYIQNELGFQRILLEPTYFEEATGEVQQYDGVYVRTDRKQVQPEKVGIELGAVVTSIGGPYRRIGSDGLDYGSNWFNSCVSSWRRIAPVSVSISEIKPTVPSIKWIETKQKPRIVEMFHKIHDLTKSHVVITNADVILGDSLGAILPKLEPDIMYYGNRINVNVNPQKPQELQTLSYYDFGFDFFILPPKLVEKVKNDNIMPANFRFGEPWWDYALPLMALHHGFVIKHLRTDPPIAVHFDHVNVSNKWWKDQGLQFLKWCEELHKQGNSPATGLLQSLAPLAKVAKNNHEHHLTEACKIFINWMT